MQTFRMVIPAGIYVSIEAEGAYEAYQQAAAIRDQLMTYDNPLASLDLRNDAEIDSSAITEQPIVWPLDGDISLEDIE